MSGSDKKRPPVVGEEVTSFTQGSLDRRRLEKSHQYPRSIHEPDGRSDRGSEGESRLGEQPGYLRWAESLDRLLEDSEGVAVFKKFLEQEGCSNALDFWFGCQGLKHNVKPGDKQMINTLIRAINRTYIREGGEKSVVGIRPETRKAISDRIRRKEVKALDQSIFDGAQREVESSLRHSLYPAFLRSDIYVSYVQQCASLMAPYGAVEETPYVKYHPAPPKARPPSPGDSGGLSLWSQTPSQASGGLLPTVEEDRELTVPEMHRMKGLASAPLTTENLLVTRFARAELSIRRHEAVAGPYLHPEPSGRPPNPYHVTYAPVSAQDSELQSLSSEAHTDETKSLTDSSLDGSHVMNSRKHLKHQRRAMRHSAQRNRDTGLAQTTLIPRPAEQRERFPSKERNLAETDPVEFVRLLTERLQRIVDERAKMEKIERLMSETGLVGEEGSGVQSALGTEGDEVDAEPGVSGGSSSTAALLTQPWAGRLMAAARNTREQEDAQAILEEHCSRIWAKSAEQTPPAGTRSPHVTSLQQHHHRHVHHHHHPGAPPPPEMHPPPQPGSDKVLAWIYESSEQNQRSGHRSSSRGATRGSHRSGHVPETAAPPHQSSGMSVSKEASTRSRGVGSHSGSHSVSSSNRSSTPAPQPPVTETVESATGLIVGYYLLGDPVPFRTVWTGSEMTLGQFKTLIAKKGNYRYFFKKASDEFETGVVQEEISNDDQVLPLWEGKIVAKVE